ncbi:hypothetical protein HYH03_005741 [Edaphochlamys debaryana]|uniref:Uncharacterized protein n=1 Tax=Edaphochlamys debaryana TaxID=47281 RepID=A0A836C1Z6_9CHLO|nr:hypothetical protein HYH03_005741 [Edaphochlamys debaryana]|eukprot:KAG2496138.1 hypothetical protein HYH03_005741 [Edaphochlamys debaryana]
MVSIFRSDTFRNLQGPLSLISLVASLVVLYREAVSWEAIPDLLEGFTFTDAPFQLTSFALSLLLVFRTDASYARWCTAQDAWGDLRTAAGDLMRKAAAWVDDTAHLRRLVRWTSAFSRCLMVELRYDLGSTAMEEAMRGELKGIMRPHELEQLMGAGPYYHQFAQSVLTALVETAQLSESREGALLSDLERLNRAAGECEKVLRFPIPLTYTRHTSRFMLIYLTALPLALYDACNIWVIPVTATIAYLLLGIEDIGVQIEEPFSILPLPEICQDLHITAQRTMAQRAAVRCLADPDQCRFDPDEERGSSELEELNDRATEAAAAAAAAAATAAQAAAVAAATAAALEAARQTMDCDGAAVTAAAAAASSTAATAATNGRHRAGDAIAVGAKMNPLAFPQGDPYGSGSGPVAAVPEPNGNGNGRANVPSGPGVLVGSSAASTRQAHR